MPAARLVPDDGLRLMRGRARRTAHGDGANDGLILHAAAIDVEAAWCGGHVHCLSGRPIAPVITGDTGGGCPGETGGGVQAQALTGSDPGIVCRTETWTVSVQRSSLHGPVRGAMLNPPQSDGCRFRKPSKGCYPTENPSSRSWRRISRAIGVLSGVPMGWRIGSMLFSAQGRRRSDRERHI